MLTSRRVQSEFEALECTRRSIEHYSKFEVDHEVDHRYLTENTRRVFRSKCFFNVVVNNLGEIVSWIVANEGPSSMHSRDVVLSQMYYHTFIAGIPAVRAMLVAHRAMITHAASKGIRWVASSSSLPNSDVFNRVLISDGWIKRGSMVVYRVTAADLPDDTPVASRLGRQHALAPG